MSYEQKLMQMKKLLKKTEPSVKAETKTESNFTPEVPFYEQQWLDAGLTKETNRFGIVYKRIVEYPSTYRHGNIQLSSLNTTVEDWIIADEVHPLAPSPDRRLLFFDTETTGLKGAGTLIFLMGFIEQTPTTFKLTQYVLPGPDHEAAFLYATNLWKEQFTLVTYNGKSFDVPQVETRWTMNRKVLPPLIKHFHIDLLHGARRIWKDEIDRFRLPIIEEEKLGFIRQDDIPGHMAPIIYQDAVKSGRPEMLMKILLHNEWDILSLVALYIHSTNLILKDELSQSAISQTNVGKWFADLKSYSRSKAILENSIAEYGIDHPLTYYHLAFIYKKEKDYQNAVSTFRIAAEGLTGREKIIAFEELAKLYEHRLKELDAALEATVNGSRSVIEQQNLSFPFKLRMGNEFKKREIRVRKKIFPGETHEVTKTLRSSD